MEAIVQIRGFTTRRTMVRIRGCGPRDPGPIPGGLPFFIKQELNAGVIVESMSKRVDVGSLEPGWCT